MPTTATSSPDSYFPTANSLVTPEGRFTQCRPLGTWFSVQPAHDYVVDDFGALLRISDGAFMCGSHYRHSHANDAAEANFRAALNAVQDAEAALAAARTRLLAALPPQVAQ